MHGTNTGVFLGIFRKALFGCFCREAICHQVQQEAHGELRDKRLLLRGRAVEGICLWCVTLNCNSMNFTDKLITVLQCTAATFYSVSVSEPIPVRFGKKSQKLFIKFSEPNPVRFGKKNCKILAFKNSEPNPVRFGIFSHNLSKFPNYNSC